jgi:RNA polymerase sigma-70 factor, ECF subfamily
MTKNPLEARPNFTSTDEDNGPDAKVTLDGNVVSLLLSWFTQQRLRMCDTYGLMNVIHERLGASTADPDEELLLQARTAPEGDLRAFEKLVLLYQRRVVANCRYITRDPNNAEDLAQEVLVKAYFGLRSFEGRSSFSGWLQRIKINHCLNHLKKQAGRSYVGIEEPEVEEFNQLQVTVTAEHMAETISDRQLTSLVLDAMSSTLRIPLVLCDMDGLSYEEVAKSLGISLSAAKMRIKRAREEFRARFNQAQAAGMAVAGGK